MSLSSSLLDDAHGSEEAGSEMMMADMAQVIAHRIRGLVTTIEGFTDLLTESLSREEREVALRIFESASRIESVLADLQTFARPVEPVFCQTSVDAVLIDLHAAIDDELCLRTDIRLAGAVGSLYLDPVLIRQALLVLVQNAAEATTERDRIRIFAEAADREIIFHVQNPGVMHPRVVRDAFRPFYTTKAHNLGAGLPIAVRIARAHRGDLSLTLNDSDHGTRFSLRLPADGTGECVA